MSEEPPALVRNPDGVERAASIQLMAASFRWSRAIDKYRRFGNYAEIEALLQDEYIPPYGRRFLAALVRGEVKRSGGRPPTIRYSDEQVAQLVERAIIEGYGFSGANGDDGNGAFCFVASNLLVSPARIRQIYYRVPELKRKQIARWLYNLLAEDNALPGQS